MSVRKCATVFAIVLLSAGYAHAFIIGIHATITRAGLFSTVLEFGLSPTVLKELDGHWFTGMAIREIVRADITRDTGDCSHTPLGAPDDTPAIPCGPSFDIDRTIDDTNVLQTFLSASGYAFENASAEHFDDELFQLGNSSILIARNAALSALMSKNFVGARKQVGYALHTVQDFYAHTNYIDLGNDCCVNHLGFSDAFTTRPDGKVFLQGLRIADKADMTCSDPSTLLTDDVEYLKSRLGPLTDRPLTSGYFPNTRSEIKTYHKCAHGLSIVGFEHGINKDDTTTLGSDLHNARHEKAMEVAQMHTANFVKGVLTDGCGSDADCVAGFLGYPRISSLDPTSANAGQAVFYLQVMGAGFGNADFKPTVMWNGRALETNVISNTRLDARVETANLATGGKVKIRVQQFDSDEDTGNVNSTLVQSNAMDFTVNGLAPTTVDEGDCPGKIHPHHHDKNYLDVNANRWNDTGYAVVEGQTLNFEVVPGGSVVWRAGGLLTGGTGEAGPDGDPRATPANTLLWADPQIDYRKVSIGALIGMVVDTDHLDASLKPKIPLIEKPEQGVKYFPIGSGGRGIGPIPATGRLYLGVNDGVFYNNGGCFQVKVTSPAKR